MKQHHYRHHPQHSHLFGEICPKRSRNSSDTSNSGRGDDAAALMQLEADTGQKLEARVGIRCIRRCFSDVSPSLPDL
jgi:hypothetical protein